MKWLAKKAIFYLRKHLILFGIMSLYFSIAVADTSEPPKKITSSNDVVNYFIGLIKIYGLASFPLYLFGKGIEFLSNKFLRIGWRIIPYDVEIFNFIKYTHESVIFSKYLDIFAKKNNLKKFIKALQMRKDLYDKDELTVYYNHENNGISNHKIITNLLQNNNLQDEVKFVPCKLDYPKNAFFGEKEHPIKMPWYNYLLPRFRRYRNSQFFSGILTNSPFIPSTEHELFEMLKRYAKKVAL